MTVQELIDNLNEYDLDMNVNVVKYIDGYQIKQPIMEVCLDDDPTNGEDEISVSIAIRQ